MGLVRTPPTLTNPKEPDPAPIEVDALVDVAAVHLCIPQTVSIQLGSDELGNRQVTVADGSKRFVPYAGPILTSFRNRSCCTGALMMGIRFFLVRFPWRTWTSTHGRSAGTWLPTRGVRTSLLQWPWEFATVDR